MSTIRLWQMKVLPTVDAIQISRENLEEAVGWCRGQKLQNTALPGLKIPTQYGIREAYEGDYLVKKMNGDFTVVDPEAFERKYEPVPTS